jgi:hypothetical protein
VRVAAPEAFEKVVGECVALVDEIGASLPWNPVGHASPERR